MLILISIHALLAESDPPRKGSSYPPIFLSTLSLRRATGGFVAGNWLLVIFLSTLSLRRATRVLEVTRNAHTDFYPRSPCGERPTSERLFIPSHISIHALLAESDWWLRCWKLAARDISIHALLAESDAAGRQTVILII